MWCGLNKSALKKTDNNNNKVYPLLISPVRLQVRSNHSVIRADLKACLLPDLDGIGVGYGKAGLSYSSATDFLLQPLASHLSFAILSFLSVKAGVISFSPLLSLLPI